jgi:hypothetical protein
MLSGPAAAETLRERAEAQLGEITARVKEASIREYIDAGRAMTRYLAQWGEPQLPQPLKKGVFFANLRIVVRIADAP